MGDVVQGRWEHLDPDMEAKVAEAMALVQPHLERLHHEYAALQADLVVQVPRDWPDTFTGGTLMGLPIVRADVTEPRVVHGA